MQNLISVRAATMERADRIYAALATIICVCGTFIYVDTRIVTIQFKADFSKGQKSN